MTLTAVITEINAVIAANPDIVLLATASAVFGAAASFLRRMIKAGR